MRSVSNQIISMCQPVKNPYFLDQPSAIFSVNAQLPSGVISDIILLDNSYTSMIIIIMCESSEGFGETSRVHILA